MFEFQSLKLHHLNWLSQMRARSEEEISKLSERVQHLQKLYESQELIISKTNTYLFFCIVIILI